MQRCKGTGAITGVKCLHHIIVTVPSREISSSPEEGSHQGMDRAFRRGHLLSTGTVCNMKEDLLTREG